MSRKRETLWKVFMLTMMMCCLVLFNSKEVSAASATVEFIDVAYYANTKGGYKGDATLIEYRGKYFLIDTGCGYNYGSSSDPLTKRLNKLINNGKYLSGIIITHSHTDHYGALSKILDTKAVKAGSVKNGGTTIYYNNTYIESTLNTILNKAKKKNIATQAINKGSIYNAYTGNKNKYETVKSNAGLYVYGASMYLVNTKAYYVNQSSMVVQLKSDNINALLLGDLYLRGLNAMKEQYGDNIMGIDYDVCKIGHHGLRGSNIKESNIYSEYNKYYKNFKAEHFVYTTYKSYATSSKESAEFYERHNYLNSLLTGGGAATWYASQSKVFK